VDFHRSDLWISTGIRLRQPEIDGKARPSGNNTPLLCLYHGLGAAGRAQFLKDVAHVEGCRPLGEPRRTAIAFMLTPIDYGSE